MIKLIKNYPYDNNYDYVKLFDTKQKQKAYFNSFNHILIDEGEEEGYIREGETFIVEFNYDYLVSQGVNYVIWNNGYKDLYCFIIRKEYVDEHLTRLYYEVDVLNTFCFDFTIKNSFIERKKCEINEITDFDEGLYIGEHVKAETVLSLQKEYEFYAMFNGIKEQVAVFNNGKLTDVKEIPSPTMKPTTTVDQICYPLHFMPMKPSYPEPTILELEPPTDNDFGDGNTGDFGKPLLSREGFRFIKGFEGYAYNPYQDSAGYWTICYGVTKHGEVDTYNKLVAQKPVLEQVGAKVSYDTKNERYAAKIFNRCKELGITKQYQFDALVSLAYNCGTGVVINDNSLMKAIKVNPLDENTIRPIWEKFYVTAGGQQLSGLVKRRKQECNMFFNKKYEVRPIGLINSKGNVSGTLSDNGGNGWLPDTEGGIEKCLI